LQPRETLFLLDVLLGPELAGYDEHSVLPYMLGLGGILLMITGILSKNISQLGGFISWIIIEVQWVVV
jgi:hypothetical protein